MKGEIGMLAVSISQLFPLTLRGWGVSCGWGKPVSGECMGLVASAFSGPYSASFSHICLGIFGLGKYSLWEGSDKRNSFEIWTTG